MPEEDIQNKDPEEQDNKQEKEKSSIKSILASSSIFKWIGITVAVLVASYFMVDKIMTPLLTPPELDQEKVESPSTEEIGPIYRFEPIIVNLNEEGARRYLKVTLNLELSNEDVIKEIELLKPRLLDSFITLFSSKKLSDIESVEGKKNLRREIVAEINSHLNTGMVINAYFIEFMIQ